jgi:hypothetical protein
MTLEDLVARLVTDLEAAGIPYMIVGSLASSYHGEPRMTRDVDAVIEPSPEALGLLVGRLGDDGLYVDADAARQALAERSQFNVIDSATGWKLDLIIRKDRPFSREEFARRQPAELSTGPLHVATAEDTILAKLEWAASGQSERQLADAAGVVAVSGDRLDLEYLDRWAAELGVQQLWQELRPSG